MENIQIWLLVVAGLRMLGATQAFFNTIRLRTNVYSRDPKSVTQLFARLFGTWTLMSFTCCLATAYSPYNKSLYFVTFMSFVFAFLHFVTETFIFRTSSFKDAIPPFIVATTSIKMVVIGGTSEKCTACTKTVYQTEKIVVEDKDERKIYHKLCLKCSHCKVTLSLGNYASMNSMVYCKPHFKQLFATKGNYDEGFGNTKHTAQWTAQAAPASSAPASFIKVEETKTVERKEAPAAIVGKFSGTSEKCAVCNKTVFFTEKTTIEEKDDKKILHKNCLKCTHCQVTLSLSTYASMNGVFYCKPHLKQLFAVKGNYDEGFGNAKHSEKWTPTAESKPASFVPVEAAAKQEKTVSSNPDVAKKFSGTSEKCNSCNKTVYAIERVCLEEVDARRIFHKTCLKCSHCQVILNLGTLAQLDGILYCKPHFKQLYAQKGNLDEGFGRQKRTDNPFPYLEKNEDYVPSVDKVEAGMQGLSTGESDVDKFKRLSEQTHEDEPVNNNDAELERFQQLSAQKPAAEEQPSAPVETELERFTRLSNQWHDDDAPKYREPVEEQEEEVVAAPVVAAVEPVEETKEEEVASESQPEEVKVEDESDQ
eukprot:gene8154-9578_t